MAGYYRYCMSENARSAYSNGEKPISKWTKAEILEGIAAIEPRFAEALKACSLATLKEHALRSYSWHHTSCRYNATKFYAIDDGAVNAWDDADIEYILQEDKQLKLRKAEMKATLAPAPIRRKCSYLVWSGSRKHPKATRYTEECEIIGNWAITSNGKKCINANGFAFCD